MGWRSAPRAPPRRSAAASTSPIARCATSVRPRTPEARSSAPPRRSPRPRPRRHRRQRIADFSPVAGGPGRVGHAGSAVQTGLEQHSAMALFSHGVDRFGVAGGGARAGERRGSAASPARMAAMISQPTAAFFSRIAAMAARFLADGHQMAPPVFAAPIVGPVPLLEAGRGGWRHMARRPRSPRAFRWAGIRTGGVDGAAVASHPSAI